MVIDNPRMEELETLMQFCSKYANIYIYGHDGPQRLLSKYLAMAGRPITGFIVSEVMPGDRVNEPFPVIDLLSIPRTQKKSLGVLISVEDSRTTQVVEMLGKVKVRNLYFLSEWNKRTIPFKMMPRSRENFLLEVNLADHCNLNCQCCDHFSPIAKPTFLDYDQYVRDMTRLAELTNHHIGLMKLQGGEPLLNPRLIDYIRVTRKLFPETYICVFTDGLLLKKWGKEKDDLNIYKAIKDFELEIRITRYPIPFDIEAIKADLKKWDIPFYPTINVPNRKEARVCYFSEIGDKEYTGVKHSVKHPFDLTGQQEPYRFISCYQFNESIVLRDGRIYTCPMIPYVHYFNEYFGENLIVSEEDSIDIYTVNSFEEIAEFCTHRAPFCRYCAVQCRTSREWKQSEHSRDEWVL